MNKARWAKIKGATKNMSRPVTRPNATVARRSTKGLQHPNKVQYDEYDGDNEQGVNPIACARDPLADISTKKTE